MDEISRFGNFIKGINSISSQVYAFLALLVGVLCVIKQQPVGDKIILGAFALLQSGPKGPQ